MSRRAIWGVAFACIPVVLFVWLTLTTRPEEQRTERPEASWESRSDDAIEESGIPQSGSYRGRVISDTLQRGESLYRSLKTNEVPDSQILQLTKALSKVLNLRRSQPRDTYTLVLNAAGEIQHFEYCPSRDEVILVERFGETLISRRERVALDRSIRAVTGLVQTSLYDAILRRGEGADLVNKFAEIFQWQVDFFYDPRKGDGFGILFEEYHKDGEFIRYGDVLAAEYKTKKECFQAVRYEDPEEWTDYYDPEGRSMRKQFLRAPFKYQPRISSGFSYRRFHPILKKRMPHLAIDYAAPAGTSVLAAADGRVVYKGWKGPTGRFLEIDHGNGYRTRYGHLSRYRRGIRLKSQVRQGEVIGYVGASGRTTGPHLHYEFVKDGKPVNPRRANIASARSVKEEYRHLFETARDSLLFMLPSEEEVGSARDHLVQEIPTISPLSDSLLVSEKEVALRRGILSWLLRKAF